MWRPIGFYSKSKPKNHFSDLLGAEYGKWPLLAIDWAPVKANSSMDSLELKVPKEDLEAHLHRVRHISEMDKKKLQ